MTITGLPIQADRVIDSEAEAPVSESDHRNLAALLPEQEWCTGCTPDDDPVTITGLPIQADRVIDSEAEASVSESDHRNLAALLPEQEWCTGCTPDDDPVPDLRDSIPGMPQDVILRATEPLPLPADWEPAWGPAPLYDIAYLACGHTVARRSS